MDFLINRDYLKLISISKDFLFKIKISINLITYNFFEKYKGF